MHHHDLSTTQSLINLKTSADGLDGAEAASRLAEFGVG